MWKLIFGCLTRASLLRRVISHTFPQNDVIRNTGGMSVSQIGTLRHCIGTDVYLPFTENMWNDLIRTNYKRKDKYLGHFPSSWLDRTPSVLTPYSLHQVSFSPIFCKHFLSLSSSPFASVQHGLPRFIFRVIPDEIHKSQDSLLIYYYTKVSLLHSL